MVEIVVVIFFFLLSDRTGSIVFSGDLKNIRSAYESGINLVLPDFKQLLPNFQLKFIIYNDYLNYLDKQINYDI